MSRNLNFVAEKPQECFVKRKAYVVKLKERKDNEYEIIILEDMI